VGISSFFPGIAGQSVLRAINQFSPSVDLGGININQFPKEVVTAGITGPVLPNNFPLFKSTQNAGNANSRQATAQPTENSLANNLFGSNLNETFVQLGLIPPNVFRGVDTNGNINGGNINAPPPGANRDTQPNQSGFGILDATNRNIFQFLEVPVTSNAVVLRQSISPFSTENNNNNIGTPNNRTPNRLSLSNGLSPDLAPVFNQYNNLFQNLEKQLKNLSGNPTGNTNGDKNNNKTKSTQNRNELKTAIEQTQKTLAKDLSPLLSKAGKQKGSEKTNTLTQATQQMVKSLQQQGYDVKGNGKDNITINGQNFSVLEEKGKTVKTRAK
jgi:hypothetical protein